MPVNTLSSSVIKVALSVRPKLHNHPSPLLSSWSSCVTGGSSSSAARCPQTGGGCWRLTLPGALGLWLSLGPASLPTRTDMVAWCVFTPKIKPARQLGAPLSFPGKASHYISEVWGRSSNDLLTLPSKFFSPSVKADQNSFGILITWTLIYYYPIKCT